MATEHRILKFLHISLVLLSSAVSITLLCLLDQRFTGRLPHLVSHYRDTAGVIVQISATILAASQGYVLCTLVNFAVRLQVFQSFISASSLNLLAALSIPRIDWGLGGRSIAIAALFTIIGPLFGAVWAGALTPLAADSIHKDGSIPIPVYSFPFNLTSSIAISQCPAIGLITTLLSTALGATSAPNATRVYPKIEVPAWSYSNRSYGVGASQGLFSPTVISNDSYTAYSYQEPGYWSQVTCLYNETSNLTITPSVSVENSPLALWLVEGSLPNTVANNVSSYTLTTDNSLWYDEVLGWSAAAANGRNMLAMATVASGHWYTPWNTMQCSIDFQPTIFDVAVNLTQSMISVTASGPHTDFDPTGSLQTAVMTNLDLISRMSSNIGISTLGTVLSANSAAMNASNPGMIEDEIYLRAGENMIAALVDDLLVAEASRQMIIDNSSVAVPVNKQFNAIRLGSPRFIYLSLAINIVLVFIVLAEAFRTKAWHHLPAFNITNLQSVIDAALLSPSRGPIHEEVEEDGNSTSATSQMIQKRCKWTYDENDNAMMLVKLSGDVPSILLQHVLSESQEPLV
ncbi:hypothetical protein D0Z07_6472 [Hyphodiscus hymeniophilus]|uniref:Transmembrane protein n=1 Tax=Hyphodiscus hymeniophilus TaxID=353542 RepID=A0A9P6VFM9_9HELO|nr:hypothetical protein D0Z07_6472 [Hyphodiscus hymeniophilus]